MTKLKYLSRLDELIKSPKHLIGKIKHLHGARPSTKASAPR